MSVDGLPTFVQEHYEVHEWKHASAILQTDFPNEWREIIAVLSGIRVLRSHVLVGGGGRSKITQSIDGAFYSRGWEEKKWETKIVVDDVTTESPTHKVDCYKNRVAVEIEWSNKDPFFDRDLNNFRLLFDLRAISVGVIITKCDEYRAVFEGLGKKIWDKYGTSTTWMSKLIPRIEGGGGAGCPILVFGIRRSLYVEDSRSTAAKRGRGYAAEAIRALCDDTRRSALAVPEPHGQNGPGAQAPAALPDDGI